MLTVTVRDDEPFEKAVRRFQIECQKAGILRSVQRKRFYEKPSRRRYLGKRNIKNNNLLV